MRDIKFRAWDSWKIRFIFFDAKDGIFSQVYKTYFRENVGPFQQYTGLTDKSGVEIYEGDIVTDGTWRVRVRWDIYGWAMGNFPFDGNFDGTWKVIGNIHQNPELLEEA